MTLSPIKWFRAVRRWRCADKMMQDTKHSHSYIEDGEKKSVYKTHHWDARYEEWRKLWESR